jgi:hypothetical protein
MIWRLFYKRVSMRLESMLSEAQKAAYRLIVDSLTPLSTIHGLKINHEVLTDRANNIVAALTGIGLLVSDKEFQKVKEECREAGIDLSELEDQTPALRALLREALPLLIRLGDYIANDGGRCETILKIREALR